MFPRAGVEQLLGTSVREWALATINAWLMLLWLTALSLNYFANRMDLPDCTQGEKAIARLYLQVQGKLKPIDDGQFSDDSNEEAKTRSTSWRQVGQNALQSAKRHRSV